MATPQLISAPGNLCFSGNPMEYHARFPMTIITGWTPSDYEKLCRTPFNVVTELTNPIGGALIQRTFLTFAKLVYGTGIDNTPYYDLNFDVAAFIHHNVKVFYQTYTGVAVSKCLPTSLKVTVSQSAYGQSLEHSTVVLSGCHSFDTPMPLISGRVLSPRTLNDVITYRAPETEGGVLPLWITGQGSSYKQITANGVAIGSVGDGLWVIPLGTLPPAATGTWSIAFNGEPLCDIKAKPVSGSYVTLRFLSSAGTWEKMIFTGKVSQKSDFDKSDDSKYYRYSSGRNLPYKLSGSYTPGFTVNTGYLNSGRVRLLEALLLSTEVYIRLAGGEETAVLVTCEELERDINPEEPKGFAITLELPKDIAPYEATRVYNYLLTEANDTITSENNKKISL